MLVVRRSKRLCSLYYIVFILCHSVNNSDNFPLQIPGANGFSYKTGYYLFDLIRANVRVSVSDQLKFNRIWPSFIAGDGANHP